MNDPKGPCPKWAPHTLTRIYEILAQVPPEEWVPPDYQLFLEADDLVAQAACIKGVGNRHETLDTIRRLTVDPKMRPVWERLQSLVEARENRLEEWTHSIERCAFAVVYHAVVATVPTPPLEVSRSAWKKAFTDVASKARGLAEAIETARRLDIDLDHLSRAYIPQDQWEEVREELASEIEGDLLPSDGSTEFYVEQGRRALQGLPPLAEPEWRSDTERNTQFDKAVTERMDWLDRKLGRSLELISVADVLREIERYSVGLIASPPFIPSGPSKDRQVFALVRIFDVLFGQGFQQPLDEVVSTIAEVVTGQSVSTDSVKMRRSRLRRHYIGQVTE